MWSRISAAGVSGIHVNQSNNGLTVLLEISGISVSRVQQKLYLWFPEG